MAPFKLFAALLLLLSAPTIALTNERPPDQAQGYLPSFSCRSGDLSLSLPATYKSVESLSPKRVEHLELIENEIKYKIVRKTLYFPGLTLGVVVTSNNPNAYLVSSAHITGSHWKRLSPFYVGQPVASAVRLLLPDSKMDPDLKRPYGTDTSTVSFDIVKGRIVGITYDCYTG